MSATNPYASKGAKTPAAETADPLEHFLGRLTALGATEDELDGVRDSWDTFEPDDDPENPEPWTSERQAEMVSANDADLREMIEAAREEYEHGTTTEEDAEAKDAHDDLMAEAKDVAAGTVADALEWVGDDPDRAVAVLAWEQDGQGRVTLLRPLQELAGE